MIVRWVAAAALFALPPTGVVVLMNGAVDRLGSAVAREAAELVRYMPVRTAPEPSPSDPEAACAPIAPAEALALPPAPERRRATRAGRKGAAAKKPSVASRGVYVPSATVIRLAQASAMPRAVPVGASGPRPAGLRLMGVSALGIGMRDGDVLIKVMGAPAISVADVVGRVAAARSRRLPQISGQFWRDGEQWNLIVEQPYMAGSAAP